MLSIFSIRDAPDVDFNYEKSVEANLRIARLRVLRGLILFAPLTVLSALASASANGLWWVIFSSCAPVLLLLLVRKIPLARIHILLVVLTLIPLVFWSFFESIFPWYVAAAIWLYLWGFEEILSGFTLRHYIDGYQRGEKTWEEIEDEHVIAKTRIWSYLLAAGTIGFGSDDDLSSLLMLCTLLAISVHTHVVMLILYSFRATRWIPHLVWTSPRAVNVFLAVASMAILAWGIALLFSDGLVQGDAAWWGDLVGYTGMLLTWVEAVRDRSWTDVVQRPVNSL